MDCRETLEYLMDMDQSQALSGDVAHHLETCATCRAEFERMAAAMEALAIEGEGAGDPAFTERIMAAVRLEAPPAQQPTSLRNWIIVGTLLLGGLFGLRFSDVMNWLRASFGPAIDIAMSLILGLFLTAYICLLVGSNLRRVQRVFRFRLRG